MSKKSVGVYLDTDVYEKLTELAEREKRPLSNYIRTLLEREIEEKRNITNGLTQIDPSIIRESK